MSKILSIFSFPSLSSQFKRKILVSQKVIFSPLFPSLPFFSIDNFSIQTKESGLSSFTLFSFQLLSLKTYALFIDWNKKPKIFFMIVFLSCFSYLLIWWCCCGSTSIIYAKGYRAAWKKGDKTKFERSKLLATIIWFLHLQIEQTNLSLLRSTISQKSAAAARICRNIGSFVACANSNCFSKYLLVDMELWINKVPTCNRSRWQWRATK